MADKNEPENRENGVNNEENSGGETSTHPQQEGTVNSDQASNKGVESALSKMSESFSKLSEQLSQVMHYDPYQEDDEWEEEYEEEAEEGETPEPPSKKQKVDQGDAFELLTKLLNKPTLKPGEKGPSGAMVQGPPNDPRVHGDAEYKDADFAEKKAAALAQEAIKAIQQHLDDEGTGKALDPDLADIIGQLFRAGISEDNLKEKMAEYLKPENAPALVNIKVNQVIWDHLAPNIRSFDVKMQKVQAYMVKGMIASVMNLNELKGQLTDSLMEAFKKGLDAFVFLVAASRELSFRRRELIKPGLNKDYAHLCAMNVPVTDFLFGDDLAQQVKDLTELNRVANQLQPRGRGRGRSRGRGFYRGRGRGFFPGRGSSFNHRRGRGRAGPRGGRGAARGKDQVTNGKMAGKLAKFVDRWRLLTNDPFILDTIEHSHLDFVFSHEPVQHYEPRPIQFSEHEKGIIDGEIATLLSKGVIVECLESEGQYISNIFIREKKDGSFRMILNLSTLNLSVEYQKFKMETLESIIRLMRKDCFMASLDLKDAYYSVPVADEHQKFLRFRWGGKLFQYTCFPNGLTSAPRKFTKMMKPVLAHLRTLGFINAIYIDDTYLQGDSEFECRENVRVSKSLLTGLGFTINQKKSVEEPSQQLIMLGFILDSVTMSVKLTPEKADKIKRMCHALLQSSKISIREGAQLIGTLCAAFSGVEFGPLHYRGLEAAKCEGLMRCHGNFDGPMTLSEGARDDLFWWIDNVSTAFKLVSHGEPSVVIETDASKEGWGAVMDVSTGGRWDPQEAQLHINCLELTAAFFGLKCFCDNLRDTHVRVMVDNSTAVAYINAMGGMKSTLCNEIAKKIWFWCIERGLWLSACHIPGKSNVQADTASRKFNDRTEWMLDREVFLRITEHFFTPDIDLFASRLNKQVPRFVSWHADPEAEAVDAFMLHWGNTKFYLFPPFSLIAVCLQKIAQDATRDCLLVVPLWTTQPWFPLLASMLVNLPVLPPRDILTLPGAGKKAHPAPVKAQLIACHCSGIPSRCKEFRSSLPTSSLGHGPQELSNRTVESFRSGKDFVVKGRLVHFMPL